MHVARGIAHQTLWYQKYLRQPLIASPGKASLSACIPLSRTPLVQGSPHYTFYRLTSLTGGCASRFTATARLEPHVRSVNTPNNPNGATTLTITTSAARQIVRRSPTAETCVLQHFPLVPSPPRRLPSDAIAVSFVIGYRRYGISQEQSLSSKSSLSPRAPQQVNDCHPASAGCRPRLCLLSFEVSRC